MFSRSNGAQGSAPAANQPTVLAPPRLASAPAVPAAETASAAPPAAPTAAPLPAGPMTIPLSKVIPGHRGDISEVTLRPPTFGDWLEIGDIQRQVFFAPEIEGGQPSFRLELQEARVGAWIKRLSGLHDAQIAQMTMADGAAVYAAVKDLLNVVRDAGN